MADIRVTTETRRLDAAISQIDSGAFRNVVAVTAFKIEVRAKNIVAVDTGATKVSIFVQFEEDGFWVIARIGPTTEYAIFIEYGTSSMPAQPFLRPPLEEFRPEFEAAVVGLLRGWVS